MNKSDVSKLLNSAKVSIEKNAPAIEILAAKAAKAKPRTPKEPKKQDSFYDEVALSLRENLGRQVKVTVGAKGGTLQVEFFDPEDLRALANKLADKE